MPGMGCRFWAHYPQETKDFARRLRKGRGRPFRLRRYPRCRDLQLQTQIRARLSDGADQRIHAGPNRDEAGIGGHGSRCGTGTRSPGCSIGRQDLAGQERKSPTPSAKVWRSYANSIAGAPPGLQGNGPDRSMADYKWCMTAIDWGWSVEDTAAKLPEVSGKAADELYERICSVGLS